MKVKHAVRMMGNVTILVGSGQQRIYPYAGGGIAYNADGSSRVDPMITGGIDIGVARNLVLDLNLNMLFQPGGTDTEFTASINYAF
ncbi:hypothetical protein [Nodosilinea sp. P-1105]|uniref:hypothetical protein n=1 Tax=Nodosilinea sp. P-1105 TaxID=2546229 RepID=UPI00146AAA93|nr:hypothetical protein [Nodosilinea sp. P-1105]NMF85796.1 hypothetical protein [Nodosilinea sp. P-1105]